MKHNGETGLFFDAMKLAALLVFMGVASVAALEVRDK